MTDNAVVATDPNTQAQTPALDAALVVTAQAAAAAPAVDPLVIADAPAAASAAAAEAAVEAVVYDTTSDPGLDLALDFVGKNGIAPEHPAMVAAMKGDFSLLEALFATSTNPQAKGWERVLPVAKEAYTRATQAAASKASTVTGAVYAVFDADPTKAAGEWAKVQAWAAANADPEEKAQINAALKAGPLQAQAVARLLKSTYEQSANATIEPARASTAQAGRPDVTTDTGPMSKREFYDASQALVRKYGEGGIQSNPEYQALANRYLASNR